MSQAGEPCRDPGYDHPPHRRTVSYRVCIWSERARDGRGHWHGSLETAAGQQWPFDTLDQLERLLCDLAGWCDPPDASLEAIARE